MNVINKIFNRNHTTLTHLAATFPAVVLTGARQVGKTTLLKTLFPRHGYVSLDLPSLAEQAETEPLSFLAAHPAPLIIDEIQYAPKIFRPLKTLIDRDRHTMGQYILTGSQKFPLMKEVSDSLAGRAGIATLEGLSLQEIGRRIEDWVPVLVRGFYPELWRNPALRPGDFYSSYVTTYLERDVRQILNVSSLRDFERFLRAAATRSGQLVNRTDLARDVGISPKTIGEWIAVLEASNQICLLEPYFENIGKRMIKSPKLYFCDPGLLCFLLGLDERSLAASPMLGAVWETLVLAELRKQEQSEGGTTPSLWFYRDSQGRELDFLKAGRGRFDLFECKWAESPDPRWAAQMEEIAHTLQKSRVNRVADRTIVCRATHPHRLGQARVVSPNELFNAPLPE